MYRVLTQCKNLDVNDDDLDTRHKDIEYKDTVEKKIIKKKIFLATKLCERKIVSNIRRRNCP